jgi:hypothetical protein
MRLTDAAEINRESDNLDVKALPIYCVAVICSLYALRSFGRVEGADGTLAFEYHIAFLQGLRSLGQDFIRIVVGQRNAVMTTHRKRVSASILGAGWLGPHQQTKPCDSNDDFYFHPSHCPPYRSPKQTNRNRENPLSLSASRRFPLPSSFGQRLEPLVDWFYLRGKLALLRGQFFLQLALLRSSQAARLSQVQQIDGTHCLPLAL